MLKKILFYLFICSTLKAFENPQECNSFVFNRKTFRHIWESLEEKPDLEAFYANLSESKIEYISALISDILHIKDIKIVNKTIKEIRDYLLEERMKNISMAYEKAREQEGIYEKNAQGKWVKIE